MSQLTAAVRPARSAKALKQIREIRKVKGAIRWHERARQKRQKIINERFEDRKVYQEVQRLYAERFTRPKKEAKRNLKEDYELGPLRPNRAVGPGVSTYGALDAQSLRGASIPVDTHRRRNENRVAKGFAPEYPLVVDDQKYFPIVADDRVMVMKGRDKGKIGVVQDIIKDSHDYIIKGINKAYADGSAFTTPEGEEPQAKHETEVPVPMENIRLVIPYEVEGKNREGEVIRKWTDVVVDKIVMERHTTGKDPFTGVEYGTKEFPEEHRFDPETGLPIFNRYIAGTRRRIQWPWETDVEEEEHKNSAALEAPQESLLRKIKNPVKTIKSLTSKFSKSDELKASRGKKAQKSEEEIKHERLEKKYSQIDEVPEIPRSEPVNLSAQFDDDTGRNIAEPSDQTKSFIPHIVYPPFPRELTPEIREHAKESKLNEQNKKQNWYEHPSDVTPEQRVERKMAKLEKQRRKGAFPETMKTPLQLRWEVARRKKLEAEEANPKVDHEALMIALGQHMEARAPKKWAAIVPEASKAEQAAELD